MVALATGPTVVAPIDLDGQGGLDLIAAGRSTPFSMLFNNSAQSSGYSFDARTGMVGTAGTHQRAESAPRAIAFVDMDRVPPLEIVVASAAPTRELSCFSVTEGSGTWTRRGD
ncbi:MAG: hypothetical protein JWO36_6794 [Myxococcales bacterium]|nr:hypothetical protein [Myxococcales bacterium]